MIVVVGGIKGGSGKTTLATNFTVLRVNAGSRVLLVDADEQNSASDWAQQRQSLGIETNWTTIKLAGKSLYSELQKLARNYDDLIIDVGGRDTTSQRSALTIADVFVIPFKPRSFDMWTLGQLKQLISEIKAINPELKCYGVINQADSQGADNDGAISMLSDYDEFESPFHCIGSRKAFGNAAAEGLGVIELKPEDKKATKEIWQVHEQVYSMSEINVK